MSARAVRGGSGGGGRRSTGRAAPARKRRKQKAPGLLDSLPIAPATARRLVRWTVILVVLLVTAATAVALRLPQKVGTAIGEQVGSAGFAVSQVELRGNSHLDRATVYRIVFGQPTRAMPLVDLDAIREQLLAYPWIREARVSRRLPDTLVVEVEERVPAAVWQHNRRLTLIDGEGAEIEPVYVGSMPNLPLVIGPGAQRRVGSFRALVEAAPRLRDQIAGATWIGDRRWDIAFRTGETLSLPEGDAAAQAALRRFAEMDERRRLLGSNFLRFDMRVEGRMIVRLREAPNGQVPPVRTPDPGAAPQDLSRTI